MASERAERWGYIGLIAVCGVAWYWNWDSFVPRWAWAFAGLGYGMWHVAKAVDRLQGEVSTLRERVWQVESKYKSHGEE